MEVGRLKRVEVTDGWGAEFTAARRRQRGSAALHLLLAVHFLRHRKSSLRKTSRRHFLGWKWFLADPDQEFRVVKHFENLNSLGLLFSLSSVHRETNRQKPRSLFTLCSLHSAGIGGSRPRGRAANTRALPGPRTRAVAAVGHRALGGYGRGGRDRAEQPRERSAHSGGLSASPCGGFADK